MLNNFGEFNKVLKFIELPLSAEADTTLNYRHGFATSGAAVMHGAHCLTADMY